MKSIIKAVPVILIIVLSSFVISNYPQMINPEKIEYKSILRYAPLQAVLFQQQSAEMKAVSYQAFNMARLNLDRFLSNKKYKISPAIVVDIDETILYNSAFQASAILDGFSYPKYWSEWMNKVECEPLPGAVEFVNYAESKKIKVLYVSNRKEEFRKATIENLKKAGINNVTNEQLILRIKDSSKEDRRLELAKQFDIIMLIGDNLADFHVIWDNKKPENRDKAVEQFKQEFGRKFIIIPNAVYGDWMDALYAADTAKEKTDSTRATTILKGLKPFDYKK